LYTFVHRFNEMFIFEREHHFASRNDDCRTMMVIEVTRLHWNCA